MGYAIETIGVSWLLESCLLFVCCWVMLLVFIAGPLLRVLLTLVSTIKSKFFPSFLPKGYHHDVKATVDEGLALRECYTAVI